MVTIGLCLIAVGGAITILNWLCLLTSVFQRRHVSPVLPGASVITAAGLALIDVTRPYWWVGLLTDPTLFLLLAAIPMVAVHEWRVSRFTRLRLLQADDPPRHFRLSLHRGGHFLLRATFEPPVPCNAYGACVMNYGLLGRWEEEGDRLRLSGYAEDRVLTLEPTETGFAAREANYPEGNEYPYDALDGLRFR